MDEGLAFLESRRGKDAVEAMQAAKESKRKESIKEGSLNSLVEEESSNNIESKRRQSIKTPSKNTPSASRRSSSAK